MLTMNINQTPTPTAQNPPLPERLFGPNSFVHTLKSAVTTAWGVAWSEELIARDLMQNFFDANRERLGEVRIRPDGRTVIIEAPTEFNLQRLFYLGSEKGDDDIGHYGEGFKAAALCLLRDQKVNVYAGSGRSAVRLRIADQAVNETALYPLEYDFYRLEVPVSGTKLVIEGCAPKLVTALEAGMSHFFHEANPLLGARLWQSWDGEFSLYESTDKKGHVFYRKLKRGEFPSIPVVLVIQKQYQLIEKKISKDRDRNAFGDEVMRIFFDHYARHAAGKSRVAARAILARAKEVWERGHPLLSEMADAVGYNDWSASDAKDIFGTDYFARSTSENAAESLQFEALERQWKEGGKHCLPQYFARFGLISARRQYEQLAAKAREEAMRAGRRKPTKAERECLALLTLVLEELAPSIAKVFQGTKASYTVAKTEALVGELRKGRDYRSQEVFLSEQLFAEDFARAVAVFLHEHAHIFGHDGSRGFSDALTELLEVVIHTRAALDAYDSLWREAQALVVTERRQAGEAGESPLTAWLNGQSRDELLQLLMAAPKGYMEHCRNCASPAE